MTPEQISDWSDSVLKHEAPIPALGVIQKRLLHAALGVSAESAEVVQAIRRGDVLNAGEEIADVMWYACLAVDAVPDMSWELLLARVEADTLQEALRQPHVGLRTFPGIDMEWALDELAFWSGALADRAKRHAFMGVVDLEEDASHRDHFPLSTCIGKIYAACVDIAAMFRLGDDFMLTCMEAVRRKLDARYEGGFSTAAVQAAGSERESALLNETLSGGAPDLELLVAYDGLEVDDARACWWAVWSGEIYWGNGGDSGAVKWEWDFGPSDLYPPIEEQISAAGMDCYCQYIHDKRVIDQGVLVRINAQTGGEDNWLLLDPAKLIYADDHWFRRLQGGGQ